MRQILLSRWNEFRQRTGFQWGGGEIIVAAILIFGILSMGSGMFGKWLRDSREGGLLMVDLHSFSSANYGVDEMPVSVPAIGLEIIQDLLGVNTPPETGRPDGVALAPSPSPTPIATLPYVGGTSISPPAGNTATIPAGPSATRVTNRTPTPTPAGTDAPGQPEPTLNPPDTAQPSPTPPAATSTPKPTLPPAPTDTPLPSPVPPTSTTPPNPDPPTSTPPPGPTPQPVNSPTPRPTRSSTLAVTPTAGYTPVVNPGTPVIP